MKKTLVCPKCEGRLIWRIETVHLPAADMTKAHWTPRAAELPITVTAGWTGVRGTGAFEAFICKGCGFTEWYAHGLEELEEDEKNGVQLIDNRPRPERL